MSPLASQGDFLQVLFETFFSTTLTASYQNEFTSTWLNLQRANFLEVANLKNRPGIFYDVEKYLLPNFMNYLFASESPPLERQGTFTKDETISSSDKKPTKIPTSSTTRIPTFNSKLTKRNSPKGASVSESSAPVSKPPTPRNSYLKSTTTDKTNRNSRIYNRSTSADSRDTTASKLQSSHSSHSLKSESKVQYGAVRKANIPTLAQRYVLLNLKTF